LDLGCAACAIQQQPMTDVQQKFRSKVAQQTSATKVYVCHQGYTVNSSCAFRFGCISVRINTLVLSTSVQSLFVILKCSESLFSAICSNRYCRAVPACLHQYVLTLISMKICRDSLYGQQSAPASRHVLDRPVQPAHTAK